MTIDRAEIIRRARSVVGVPFRPQGRDATLGLDCVGVVLHAYDLQEVKARCNYRLRGAHREELERELEKRFRRKARAGARAGDVLLCAIAAEQFHLVVHCGASFVHADAGIGAVVETPGAPRWPVIAAYSMPHQVPGTR